MFSLTKDQLATKCTAVCHLASSYGDPAKLAGHSPCQTKDLTNQQPKLNQTNNLPKDNFHSVPNAATMSRETKEKQVQPCCVALRG